MQKLFAAKITQLQMVRDRGFIITPELKAGYFDMDVDKFSQYLDHTVKLHKERLQNMGGAAGVSQLNDEIDRTSVRSILSRVYFDEDTRGISVFYGSVENKEISVTTVRNFIAKLASESEIVKSGILSDKDLGPIVNKLSKASHASNNIVAAIFIGNGPLSSKAKEELAKLPIPCQFFLEANLAYNVTEHILCPKHILLTPEEKEAKLAELKVSSGKKLPAIQIKDPVVQYYGWELGNVIKITRDTGIAYRIVVDEQI